MSTDLLFLALAAGMPLALFALYAGLRSLADAWGRRRRRARRSRSRVTGVPSVRFASTPPERPKPARRMLAKLTVSRPALSSSGNGHAPLRPAMAVAPDADRINQERSLATPNRSSPDGQMSFADRPVASAPAPSGSPSPVAHRARGGQDQVASGRGDGVAPPASRRSHGLSLNPLKPILTVFGRAVGHRRPSEPSWPEPNHRDDLFLQVDAIGVGSGPCPFCAESRDRGAWFCRRCRRPVDARATAATAALNLATAERPELAISPPATPPPAMTATRSAEPRSATPRPTVQPVPRESGPVDLQPAGLRPTHYVPATRPVGAPIRAERSSAQAPATRSDAMPAGLMRDPAAGQPGATPSVGPIAAAGARPTASTPVVVRQAAIVAGAPRIAANRTQLATPPRNDAPRGPLMAVGLGRPTTGPPSDVDRATDPQVDLNHATAQQLSTLRGVGRVTAQRIIAARAERSFTTVDALVDRRIVGRSVLDKLRDRVTV